VHHCMFPVTFFTYENKGYLIAGKDWNRVDLYDPETGESLRERDCTLGIQYILETYTIF
jgi:hypothetical protein